MNRNLIKSSLTFVFLSLFHTVLIAQNPDFHIYLCFGQSNMEGQGTIEQQDQNVDSRFQVMQAVDCDGQPAEEWRTANPPISRCNTGLGPADYFGRTMVENLPSDITIGIVHVAVAGCKIELFDKDNYEDYAAGEAQWMQNIIAEYGGNPYGRLVELAQIAQQDGIIKGILLHQGESNSGEQDWPDKVKVVYDDLLNDLNLNAEEVPLLAGEVVGADQNGQTAAHNNIINELPGTIPTAHVISSEGCTAVSDNLHFDSEGYRLLGTRYAETMLDLLDANTGLNVQIIAPEHQSTVEVGDAVPVEAEVMNAEGGVDRIEFFIGDSLIGSDNTAPYAVNWQSTVAGNVEIRAIATDQEGNMTEDVIEVTVNTPQGPYNDMPHVIPGTIQLEEFDVGGNGSAYYDDSEGSETEVDFRNNEDVDIEESSDDGGGYNIGWATSGEWLEYTVQVESAGMYDLELRVACAEDGRTVDISMDEEVIAGGISIPNTGDWQTWETITVNDVELDAGEQVMRLTIGSEDYVNMNYIAFEGVITNVPDRKTSSVSIFPNPFTSGINIQQAGSFRYRINDANGTLISSGEGNDSAIIGQNIDPGLYFITIEHGKAIDVYKIVKR